MASTAVAAWGNSDAIRIPRDLLRRVGLKTGDPVTVAVNDRGNLEISPEPLAHRRCAPATGVTFDSLFKGYRGGRLDNAGAWEGDDDLVGAEREAWAR